VKFLIDNQLPMALSRFLAARGFECQHVLEIGLASVSDSEIWRYADEGEFVVISKDEDFLYLASKGESRARFVWVRFGNCRTSALLAAIERLWPRFVQSLASSDRVIELRD